MLRLVLQCFASLVKEMINIDLQLFAFEIFRFPVSILQAFPPALLCFAVSSPRLLAKKCLLFSFSNAAKVQG